MTTDPFECNDRQDKVARSMAKGINVLWSMGLVAIGIVLIVLGANGTGGALPIVIGVLALACPAYNIFRPFRM